jgi:hypothetical protein
MSAGIEKEGCIVASNSLGEAHCVVESNDPGGLENDDASENGMLDCDVAAKDPDGAL